MSKLKTLRAIISGFANYHFPTESIEKIAKDRAVICANCQHANPEHIFKNLLDDQTTVEVKGLGCDICNCLLTAKVRQLFEGCPLKKWN